MPSRKRRSQGRTEEEGPGTDQNADDTATAVGLIVVGGAAVLLFSAAAVGLGIALGYSAAQDRPIEGGGSIEEESSGETSSRRRRPLEVEPPPEYPYESSTPLQLEVQPAWASAHLSTTGKKRDSGIPWPIILLFCLFAAVCLGGGFYDFLRPAALVRGTVDQDLPEAVIAVMGATGSGKSSFINLVSGSSLGVCKGLRSCTTAPQAADAFNLGGHRVVLIDTPGFDDTTLSDTEVLNMIAAFLATSYERGTTLAGVLYFHRISDLRMTGISRKNFGMFRKLCGNSTLQNVVIVTNMWEEVDRKVGEAREAELEREDIFFKPALEKGARMTRHENTVASAEKIVRLVLGNHPLPLRIQEELVAEHKDISETSAGEELNKELNAQIRKHKQEVQEMQQAMRSNDKETKKELAIETQRMREEIEKLQNDRQRMSSSYKHEKERLEAQFKQIKSESTQEADRIAAQYQQQLDELLDEKAQLLKKINNLSGTNLDSRNGIFSKMGEYLDRIFLVLIVSSFIVYSLASYVTPTSK